MTLFSRFHQPTASDSSFKRDRSRSLQNSKKILAMETGIKLAVNAVLGSIALSSLVQIAAHSQSQYAHLKEVRAEVVELEVRVNQLQTDFKRRFDPHQAMRVMQEESDRIDPRRRQIRWIPLNALAKQPLKRQSLADPEVAPTPFPKRLPRD
jgi:cell division protein FtsB